RGVTPPEPRRRRVDRPAGGADRPAAQRAAQRDHAHIRVPEAGIDVARAVLPRRPLGDGRDADHPGPQRQQEGTARRPPQGGLFKKIYEDELGTPGDKPFGCLIGDFEFGKHLQDFLLLEKLSQVAAAAFAPFIAAAGPSLFGMDSYTELQQPRDLAMIFQGAEYIKWRSFRDSEDSRYVGLTLPRVLGRLPYGEATDPVEAFRFEEDVTGKEHDKYLWMNAAWAMGARLT